MPDEAPFMIVDEPGRVELQLPPRPAELLRPLQGCGMAAAAILTAPIVIGLTAMFWPHLGAAALGIAGLLCLLAMLLGHRAAGLAARPPRVWIEAGTLFAEESFLPLRLRRACPLAQLRGLMLAPFGWGSRHPSGPPHMLFAQLADGQPVPLVIGYPEGMLRAMAEELSRQLPEIASRHEWKLGTLEPPRVVTTLVTREVGLPLDHVPTRPEKTNVRCDHAPDGVTLTIPAEGPWRGSHGLFPFGVLWTAITGILAVGWVVAGKQLLPEFPTIVLAVFPLLGLIFLVIGWVIGRRSAVLAKVGDALMVLQTGGWSRQQHEWPVKDVTAIYVGGSTVQVNGRPLPQLIIQAAGARHTFLMGRSAEELAWIGDELARACGLQSGPPAEATEPPTH